MNFFKFLLIDFTYATFFLCSLFFLLLLWCLVCRVNRRKKYIIELQKHIFFLQGELDACRKSKISKDFYLNKNSKTALKCTTIEATLNLTAVKKDDLKIVEGIGSKIEELFNNASIFTFAELAQTSVEQMKAILDAAGSRFRVHNPATWAEQAALARDGRWDELKKWQDKLFKGRI